MRASTAKKPRSLGTHQIIEISLVLHSAHVVPKNQDKFVFYIHNYIYWDQFNQSYDPDWIKKGIKNPDAIACKFGLALIRAINNRLEVAKEKKRKKE